MSEEKKEPTIIEDDAYAVTWSPDAGWSILVPKDIHDNPGSKLPNEAAALFAVGLRLEQDHEFRVDCIEWLERQRRS